MAISNSNESNSHEESSPLLSNQVEGAESIAEKPLKASPAEKSPAAEGWTADGLPLGHGSVVGEPIGRTQWDSGLFSCLGRNDEFCSSDLEVCKFFFSRIILSESLGLLILKG